MDFSQAEEKFRGLKARFAAGDLTEADFKAQLEELMVEDEAGNWWMLGYETERWYRYDGANWVQQDPPGRTAVELAPTPAPEPGPVVAPAAEPTPAAPPAAEPAQAKSTQAADVPAVPTRAAAPAAPAARPKRSPVLFIGLGAIALIVCAVVGFSLFRPRTPSSPATEPPAMPTAPEATEAPISANPTAASEPTAQPTDLPTEAPSAVPTANLRFFTEEFDSGSANWDPFVTSGKLDELKVSSDGGTFAFDLTKRQLWAYAVYTPETYQDVRIEAEVENLGNNDNNITLFCRYDRDLGWYELSIANSGLYWIYRGKWDSNGVTASYSVIADGGSNNIRQGKAINTYALACTGNTISAYINDKLIKTASDDELTSGNVGIGVSSFQSLPIAVNYDWVKISAP